MFLRSSSASDANTATYQKMVIDGLTYQPSAYYFLRLTNTTTGAYVDVNSSSYNGGGSSPNYYTIAVQFSVSPNTVNNYKAEARYLSSNSVTTVTNSMTSPDYPRPDTPSASVTSQNGTSVTIEGYAGANTQGVQLRASWGSTFNNYCGSNNFFSQTLTTPAYGSYYVDVYGFNPNYFSSSYTRVSFTTTAPPPPPAPSYAPSIDSRTANGFYVSISSPTGATSYSVRARIGSTVYASVNTTSTSNILISGLDYGTSYTLESNASNANGTSGWSPASSGTTLPQTVQINGNPLGGTGIRIQLESTPSGGWTDVEIERWTSTGGTYLDSKFISYGSNYVDWAGLSVGTTYKFKSRTRYYVNSTYLYSYSYSSWVDVKTGVKPADWLWTTGADASGNKISGGDFSMTAVEWNAFQDRVNEYRAFKGLSAFPYYSYYNGDNSFTRAVSGSNFYYYQMNQAINAINSMVASGVSQKSSGNDVYASDLNALKNKINSIVA